MPTAVLVIALAWTTLLLVAGALQLLRTRDVLQRLVALDLLAILMVALLTLLCFLLDRSYYLNAAMALAMLSFVATVATARYLGSGGPFE
ncbi:pH regulation protein F [Mycolicibacterium flavescens]|uniref:pH regulation protein F n=1 Tax=Mycolicibacterium flavescens TaxID=1776 RepID=A0A1E3RD07_MYCFV|nr:monovalent cation/H+ antiporter complex subunit F [Mycolicibacterium flavescens]MCV7280106.1 pH regulation protein F [Mycolicibacterium flavescens]ODQ87691.1 pH regulation protein F [Mycolicibacterium flavescens]